MSLRLVSAIVTVMVVVVFVLIIADSLVERYCDPKIETSVMDKYTFGDQLYEAEFHAGYNQFLYGRMIEAASSSWSRFIPFMKVRIDPLLVIFGKKWESVLSDTQQLATELRALNGDNVTPCMVARLARIQTQIETIQSLEPTGLGAERVHALEAEGDQYQRMFGVRTYAEACKVRDSDTQLYRYIHYYAVRPQNSEEKSK